MQQLMSMSQGQTMTSKELVEVINAIRKEEGNDTEIQHSDLVKRIKGFASILGEGSVSMAEYLDAQSKPRPMLLLSKRASMLAVSAESPRINLAIIDRWQQLEMQARPLTYIESLELLLASEKEKEALRIQKLHDDKQMEEDAVLTAKSSTYYPVSHLKKWIPTASGKLLSRMSEQLGYEVRTIYNQYDSQTPIQTYHKDVINTVHFNQSIDIVLSH
jgi:hypothetical protein